MSLALTSSGKVETAHFERSFQKYLEVTGRTFVDAVNNKMFMIARKASWFTHRASARDISRDLGKVTYLRQKNHQRIYRHSLKKSMRVATVGVPLAALIIQKRQGPGQGYYGEEMRRAIQQMVTARNVSIAYIASGWIPSIQTLATVATIKAPNARDDKAARQIGKPKGSATIAKRAGIIKCEIRNEAYATRDVKGAFEHYGNRGLQASIDSEWADNVDQIKKAMQPAIDQFNGGQR